jgi:TPR repeat protein
MRNFDLTCGKNILEKSVELTMKRNLTILSQVFLMCTLFTNAWGVTNYDRCVEAYFKDKDYTNAYNICKEVEDPNAQYIIGEMYYYGLGVKEDYAEAAIWFRKAAEQGNPESQFVIGKMYYYGVGVKKDHAEAIIWFRKAASKGHIGARVLRDKMLYKEKSK